MNDNEALITGQPIDGGVFEAKNYIERIEIRGLKSEPSEITVSSISSPSLLLFKIVRSSDPTQKLQYVYDRDHKTLTIRKPNVLITQSYKIKILF